MLEPQYTIGIDPDADRHGVAIYIDGILVDLDMLQLQALIDLIKDKENCLVSIEDVISNQFIYGRNQHSSKAAQSKIAMHVGRCQQAYVELTRQFDYHGINYVSHKPQGGNWAKKKAQFERVTGWSKRSNEDTRAAAFFGFLALKRIKIRD